MDKKIFSVRFDLIAECQTVLLDLSEPIDAREWIFKSLEQIPQLKHGLPLIISDLSLQEARASFSGKQLYFANFTVQSSGLIVKVKGRSKDDVINYLKLNNEWLTSIFIVPKKHLILNVNVFEIAI